MPKVICTLPNASHEISGVKFSPRDDGAGVVSEEISAEVAAQFLAVSGYTLAAEPIQSAAGVSDGDTKDAEKAALIERADAIGFKVKSTWGLERLTEEVARAEKAAAEKATADATAAACESE